MKEETKNQSNVVCGNNPEKNSISDNYQTYDNSNFPSNLPIPSANTLKNLKEKKENPFWMPAHNAEIFEVRDILRQEKELKKAINRSKQNRKKGLDSIHKNYLKEKESAYINLQSNENSFGGNGNANNQNANFYITEQKGGGSQNLQEFLEKFNKLTGGETTATSQPLKVLQNIAAEKETEMAKKEKEGGKEKLQKKIDALGGKKNQSVRDFINKTREIILMKYSIDIKKERAVRVQETYNNEIESIKDSIFSMQEARKLFEKEFIVKFEEYVKHLVMQKEKEKAEEVNLLETKMKLDAENKRLLNKISKQEEKRLQYEDYRDFMIQLKEKMLKIPEHYKQDVLMTTKRDRDPSGNTNTTGFYVTSDSFSQRGKMKRQTTQQGLQQDEKERMERFRNYYNQPIFESAQELIDELRKMEADNLAKLNEYNEVNSHLVEAEKELQKLKDDDKAAFEYINSDIEKKEKQLKELKEKNRKLNEERNSLLKENNFTYSNESQNKKSVKKFTSLKNRYNEPQLFAKILEVYKSSLEYYSGTLLDNPYINLENTKKNPISTEVESNMLLMLKFIEKSLDNLITLYFSYRNKFGSNLKQVENKLEYDRKQNKNKEMKIQNMLEEQRKRVEMEERNNKIYIIPKRKLEKRCPPRESGDKEKKNDKNDKNEHTFEDFISF